MKKYGLQVILLILVCGAIVGTCIVMSQFESGERVSFLVNQKENSAGVTNKDKKDNNNEKQDDQGSQEEQATTEQITTQETTKAPANLIKQIGREGFTQLEAYAKVKRVTEDEGFNFTLSFTGDCLIATNEGQYYANCLDEVANNVDPSYFFEKTSKYFKNDDYTIVDCENVFSDSTNLVVRDKGQYANPGIEAYWFKSKSDNAKIFPAGGVEFASISNNHIMDYGEQGRIDTKAALDAAGVEWGEEDKIVYQEKNGYKIAIICASMYGYYQVEAIKGYLAEAEKNSDYQLLYFHGGEEALHQAESWKIDACHDLVDAGYDLIIGDHPHVLQPMEEYNGATIVYSLGNFIFGGNRHPENRTIIYQHIITIKDGRMVSQAYKMIPCYVFVGDMNNWQPAEIEDENEKNRVLEFMHGQASTPY